MKIKLSENELRDKWSLSSHELNFISSKQNKLVFAIKLKFLEKAGYIPKNTKEIPKEIVRYIAKQIGSSDDVNNYPWDNKTSRRHNEIIREHLDFTLLKGSNLCHLKEWLFKNELPFNATHAQLKESVLKYCYKSKIEPSTSLQIDRYLTKWRSEFESRFFQTINQMYYFTI